MAPLDFATTNLERFVTELESFLRIPSVSTDPSYSDEMGRCAQWLVEHFNRIGASESRIVDTPGHPIVLARYGDDPNKPTVLCYGHYDVQPADPLDLWHTPPFAPSRRNGAIYARGASDDKGQVFMHLKALESYTETGTELPVNLKFIIEGEEEVGSAHLGDFIREHRDWLEADVVLISDTALFARDVPSITCGLRGLAYVEVSLTGPARDLHSGVYGGAVANPINVLSRMIGDLHDAQNRVTIPGFYDDVIELTSEQRLEYATLPFDRQRWLDEIGVRDVTTEEGYTILESVSCRPALDVNGIWGGFQGDGAKTVLPAVAGAKISMRLVPDQRTDDIVAKTRAHFEAHTPPTMTLSFKNLHGGSPVVVDTSTVVMRAAAQAMEAELGTMPVFTREGGSIPVVADFKRILGIDTVLFGFGLNSDAIHSPNEHFEVDRFAKGTRSIIRFFANYGAAARKAD